MAVDNFPKGTYEARVVEHPGRRTFTGIDPQTGEPTGETKVYDVTLNEGTVTQQGTAWTPSVMNDLENRIGNSVGQIKSEFTATQYKNDSSLTTDAQTVVGGINEANAKAMNIANVFSTSSTYAVGAYCLYQNVLYKCTVAVTTAGEWDENKWTQVKVANELGSGGGGASSLVDLTDTDISSPTDKQALVYDATTQKWKNGDSSGFALEKTASGAVVSITDGADDLPVIDLTAQITAVQSGSGDPSPSNIRPISGFTGVNVKRTGINFFDEVTEQGSIDITTGQNVYANNRLRSKNYLPVKGGQTYRIYLSGSSTLWMAILTYDANKNFLANLGGKTGNSTITLDSNVCYLRFYLDSGYGLTYNNDISINYPSTDTSYHAYNGQTYSVTWQSEAGTVYGGSIDLTTGVLTVTHGRADLGSLSWTRNLTYGVFLTTSLGGVNTEYNALCEIYKFAGQVASAQGAYNKGDKTFSILTNDARHIIYIRDDSYSDSDTFTEAVNGHYLVYELATPQTYQLTPTEVKTLLGVNNIFADTGDVTVDYQTEQASDIAETLINDDRTASNTVWSSTKVNTQLSSKQNTLTAGTGIDITSDTISVTDYIKDVSVANEYDATATYAVGDYCIHGGLLYICTTAISTAEDWDATHWTQTNVMSQMPATPWKDVIDTLSAGSTSITLSDASITTSSTIDIYTDPPEIPHNSMTVTTGNVALTFDAQQSATIVKVRIS